MNTNDIELLEKYNAKLDEYKNYFNYNNNYKFIIKKRNITSKSFKSALINKSKLIFENIIIIFEYTNGVYYIKYNDELFKTFKTKLIQHDIDDCFEPDLVYEIPINLLIKY
jgi:hypothetical protein